MRLTFATALSLTAFVVGSGVATAKDIVVTGTSVAVASLKASNTRRAVSRSLGYSTVEEAMDSGTVKSGDRILLAEGSHTGIVVRRRSFSRPVTIMAAPGATAQVEFISVLDSDNIVFKDINVWPEVEGAGVGSLIRTDERSKDITFENIDVRSTEEATNYLKWSRDKFIAEKRSAFQLEGDSMVVRDSKVTGVFNGIVMQGPNALIENNTVQGFTGDAMRALGDNSTVRRNTVRNCFSISETHTDGFQSWSTGEDGTIRDGVRTGITLEYNNIMEWDEPVASSFKCTLQGMYFGGNFKDVTIRNNSIRVSSYNGIMLSAPENVTIVQNTIVHTFGEAGNKPRLAVIERDGKRPRNVLVANNAAQKINVVTDPFYHVLVGGNYESSGLASEFTSFPSDTLTLKTSSGAIDAGLAEYMTSDDITGTARYKGKAPDAGAYEVN